MSKQRPVFGDVLLCPMIQSRRITKGGKVTARTLFHQVPETHNMIALYLGTAPHGANIDVERALDALGWQRKP